MQRFTMRCAVYLLSAFSLLSAHATELISVSTTGDQGNAVSVSGRNVHSISADNRYVVFWSFASNLAENDTNNNYDVFVRDLQTNTIELVSLSSTGTQGNSWSAAGSISNEGRYVAFTSNSTNLSVDDDNSLSDVFVRDRNSGTTELISQSTAGIIGNDRSDGESISGNGRFVTFNSNSSNLVDNDANDNYDVFVHDRRLKTTELVSRSLSGAAANGPSLSPSISNNGRYITYSSGADDIVANDNNIRGDIFVYDRITKTTEMASIPEPGARVNPATQAGRSAISDDGRFVFFSTTSALTKSDNNPGSDVFVRDRLHQTTHLISITDPNSSSQSSFVGNISANGRHLVFLSSSTNQIANDTNSDTDIFVYDLITNTTNLVSVTAAGFSGNETSQQPSISSDGQLITYSSKANDLVIDDNNNQQDVFLAENELFNNKHSLEVTLKSTSGVTEIGKYSRFRAMFKNTGEQPLTNCRALIANPPVNFQRKFSFYTFPLKVSNPVINAPINILPGRSGLMNLAVLPREQMRREVKFEYVCDQARAKTISFVNTIHLNAETAPFDAEDYVQLTNSNNKTELVIDRGNNKFWSLYALDIENSGNDNSTVTLSATTPLDDIDRIAFCEVPGNGNWQCLAPRSKTLIVNNDGLKNKKILVFLHSTAQIAEDSVSNRVFIQARNTAGDIVSQNSMGVHTIN